MNIIGSALSVLLFCSVPAMSTVEQLKLLDRNEIYTGSDVFYDDWSFFPSNDDSPLIERSNLDSGINREIYTVRGYSLEPREFWRQSIKQQMLYLKDTILEYDLVNIIDKRYRANCVSSFSSSSFKDKKDAYSEEFVEGFNHSVYLKMQDFIEENELAFLSEDDFNKSLTRFLLPTSDIYDYPILIIHFAPFLCPRWSTYSEKHPELSNKKFPSKFEEWLMEEGKS